ncbi:MAG: hypothetical protein JW781_03440 [Deltaproteobacteria bacterium]|nr:hypothetical protein [Candidatus Anaeroferrophillacea bacterium]
MRTISGHLKTAVFAVCCTLLITAAGGIAAAPAAAAAYDALLPLFIDLPGWNAEPAEGMAMDMGGSSMVSATREYRRGEAQFSAVMMTGQQAGAMAATVTSQGKMKIETSEVYMAVETIAGFPAYVVRNKQEQSGSITILLDTNPDSARVFTVGYEHLDADEALTLAKKFDWPQIKKTLP